LHCCKCQCHRHHQLETSSATPRKPTQTLGGLAECACCFPLLDVCCFNSRALPCLHLKFTPQSSWRPTKRAARGWTTKTKSSCDIFMLLTQMSKVYAGVCLPNYIISQQRNVGNILLKLPQDGSWQWCWTQFCRPRRRSSSQTGIRNIKHTHQKMDTPE
jgi:hypothetical protein